MKILVSVDIEGVAEPVSARVARINQRLMSAMNDDEAATLEALLVRLRMQADALERAPPE